MEQEDMHLLRYPVLRPFEGNVDTLAAKEDMNTLLEGSTTSSDVSEVSEDEGKTKGRLPCFPPGIVSKQKRRRHVKPDHTFSHPKSSNRPLKLSFSQSHRATLIRAKEALSTQKQGEIPNKLAGPEYPTPSSRLTSMPELSSSSDWEEPFPAFLAGANVDPSPLMGNASIEGVASPPSGSLIPENIARKLSVRSRNEFSTDSDSDVSEDVTIKPGSGRTLKGSSFKVQKRLKKASADKDPFLMVGSLHRDIAQIMDLRDPPMYLDLSSSDPGTSKWRIDGAGPSFSSSVNRFELMSMRSESASGGESDAQMEMETSLSEMFEIDFVTDTERTLSLLQTFSVPDWRRRYSLNPSPSEGTSAESLRHSQSLPNICLKSSFEDFTPDFDEDDESYRFLCSSSGRYQCSVTGLVFHMEGEGDLVYRTIPWNKRMLAKHQKQPAGPLFHIKCVPPSAASQLYLPHCEIRSTGGCELLSVAHVYDEDVDFLVPHRITETHVLINISGFSAFGNVKDDSAVEPVQALVLPFYQPPVGPDVTSLLDLLLLPKNIVLEVVLRTRKKSFGNEVYIKTPPHCRLLPMQMYTLSSSPEDDSVLVQPTEAEFDCNNYDNYFASFQVILDKLQKHLKLSLRDANKHSVWDRRVCLSGGQRSCMSNALQLIPNERLMNVRRSFIDGVSGPVLQSLLDELFEKKVMGDSERESAVEMKNQRNRARFVIDTVRKKGEEASSVMINFLCKVDPFLSEHLGLI